MFPDWIAHFAVRAPGATAVSLPATDVSFSMFDRAINRVAHHLAAAVPQRARVAIMADNQYLHWLLVLALGRLGAVSVSLDPVKQDILLPHVAADIVIADRPVTGGGEATAIDVSGDWMDRTVRSGDASPIARNVAPDDPARITLSSGTTGRPKKVLFNHRAVMQDITLRASRQPLHGVPRLLMGIGLDAKPGFTRPLGAWACGGTLCLGPVDPVYMLGKAVNQLMASPHRLHAMMAALPADFPILPHLTVLVGGSRLSPALVESVRLRLTPNLLNEYSSTEAGGIAIGPAWLLGTDPDVAGIVLPGVKVEILGDEGTVLGPGEVGAIRVRSETMVSGYLDDEEATRRAFRDGWFHPGDVGSVSGNGLLSIVGRIDDLMNFGGVKLAPALIEDVLMRQPGVRDAGLFSRSDAAGLEHPCAAVVADESFDGAGAADAIRQALPGPSLPVEIYRVTEIPRNRMDKIERKRLREAALSSGGPVSGS